MRLVIKFMLAVLVLSAIVHVAGWMTTGIQHAASNYQARQERGTE